MTEPPAAVADCVRLLIPNCSLALRASVVSHNVIPITVPDLRSTNRIAPALPGVLRALGATFSLKKEIPLSIESGEDWSLVIRPYIRCLLEQVGARDPVARVRTAKAYANARRQGGFSCFRRRPARGGRRLLHRPPRPRKAGRAPSWNRCRPNHPAPTGRRGARRPGAGRGRPAPWSWPGR